MFFGRILLDWELPLPSAFIRLAYREFHITDTSRTLFVYPKIKRALFSKATVLYRLKIHAQ
jgi:hypothetical protein